MGGHYFLVSLGYTFLTIAVGVFEAKRIRTTGPDAISVFVVLFVLECCLPGIVIYACLPLTDALSPTGVPAVDRIFAAADLPAAYLVLGLTAWFISFFYGFAALSGRLLRSSWGGAARDARLVLSGSPPRLVVVLAAGLALSLASFYVLGDSLLERYTNLIFFRAGAEQGERRAY